MQSIRKTYYANHTHDENGKVILIDPYVLQINCSGNGAFSVLMENATIRKSLEIQVKNSFDYVYDIKKTQINALDGAFGLFAKMQKPENEYIFRNVAEKALAYCKNVKTERKDAN